MISQSLSLMGATVVVATNGKANEEQQMTNFFPVNKRVLMLQPGKNEATLVVMMKGVQESQFLN